MPRPKTHDTASWCGALARTMASAKYNSVYRPGLFDSVAALNGNVIDALFYLQDGKCAVSGQEMLVPKVWESPRLEFKKWTTGLPYAVAAKTPAIIVIDPNWEDGRMAYSNIALARRCWAEVYASQTVPLLEEVTNNIGANAIFALLREQWAGDDE